MFPPRAVRRVGFSDPDPTPVLLRIAEIRSHGEVEQIPSVVYRHNVGRQHTFLIRFIGPALVKSHALDLPVEAVGTRGDLDASVLEPVVAQVNAEMLGEPEIVVVPVADDVRRIVMLHIGSPVNACDRCDNLGDLPELRRDS